MPTVRYYSSTSGRMELAADITNSSTSMIVDTTTGLPGATPFTLVIDEGTVTEEILDCTGVAGTTLTISRGVDGSPASAHVAGATVRHMAIARDFRDANTHQNASADVHGIGASSSVVGTDTTQTIKNKTAQASAAGTKGLIVKGTTSQTAPYLEVQDVGGGLVFKVTPDVGGTVQLGGSTVQMNESNQANFLGFVSRFVASGTGAIVAIFKRIAGQTANIIEVQNESGTVLAKFDSAGALTAPTVTSTGTVAGVAGTFSGAVSGTTGTFSGQAKSNGLNVVTLSETQTLTNKSLTSPTITGTGAIAGSTGTFSGAVTGSNVSSSMPWASSGKAGKRIHWDTYTTASLDASGYATVTHGAGFTPVAVVPVSSVTTFVSGQADGILSVDSFTPTTFRVRAVKSETGAVVTGVPITFTAFLGE